MPGTALTVLTKEGCFDADARNAVNSNATAIVANTPGIVGTSNLAAQGFAVFNTATAITLVAAGAPAGSYRVSLYLVITTTFVTNTAVTGAFGWTDDNGAQTLTVTGGALTAGTTLVGSQIVRSTGAAAITFTPAKTGSAATAGVASFSVVAERMI